MGRLLIFFLGGRGRGRGGVRASTAESFSQDDSRFQTAPFFYVLYYVLRSGGFRCSMLQDIAKSSLDLDALGRHVALFGLRQPVDLFHASTTVKGTAVPRSATDSTEQWVWCFYAHAVYVICYFCYMFSLGTSSGSSVSVRIYRRVTFGKQNWRCTRTPCT